MIYKYKFINIKVTCFRSRKYLFIQMEFCEGGTLTTWIRERTQRTTREIHKVFYEIVSGVEYVHSKNLIHRDLKVFCLLLYLNCCISHRCVTQFTHVFFYFSLITYCLVLKAK